MIVKLALFVLESINIFQKMFIFVENTIKCTIIE